MHFKRELLLLMLLGCDGADSDTDVDPCDASPITYETFGDGYMRTWCTSCHSSQLPEGRRAGAPLTHNYDTYEGVQANIDRILARATGGDPTMPEAGGPPPEDVAVLQAWLECGGR